MKKSISLVVIAAFFTACTPPKKDASEGETKAQTVTQYQYQRAFTTLEWTAYKTTAKVGVKGSFDEFNVTPGQETGAPSELLNALEFSIPVATTNSDNEIRDPKIIESFFGTMMNTETITGTFTQVDDSAGSLKIEIVMNEVSHMIDGSYSVDGNEVTVSASMDLADWKAEPSVSELNKVCTDLHKGEDGVSKLWPNVDLEIKSKLKPIEVEVTETGA